MPHGAGSSGPDAGRELPEALTRARGALIAVGFFSALINILMLTSAFYMLEVYDRVIPSRSIPTLVVLSVLALVLFAFQGILEIVRSRVLVRIGNHLDEASGERVFDVMTRAQGSDSQQSAALQPMRDVDAIKAFLSSSGPGALFDLPWLPIYIAVMFVFHWILGVVAVAGAVILFLLTLLTEIRTKRPTQQMTRDLAARTSLALSGRRNAEVVAAMGMGPRLARRYRDAGVIYTRSMTQLNDLTNGMGSLSRVFRMALQSFVLGVGALLVIWNESSAGIMITGSILIGRALAPVDQAISNWKRLIAARQGWARLSDTFRKLPPVPKRMPLPPPNQSLKVERLSVAEPGGQRPLIRDISFSVRAGQGLCIIGPSGAGKSTLVRALVNAWRPAAGRIELDGAALEQWPPEELGNQIGYLSQDVELFSGTIEENISRLEDEPDPARVIDAAVAAGAHAMIVGFRDGYRTQIGEGGNILSAGQRQRIALARALYGNPFLVVLDEPNAHLDAEGDAALQSSITAVRARNGIVIAVSHRPGILEAFDLILLLKDGQVVGFGPRDEMLARHFRNSPAVAAGQRQTGAVVPMNRPQPGLADGASTT